MSTTTSVEGYQRTSRRRDDAARLIADAVSGLRPHTQWYLDLMCQEYRDYNERCDSILEEWAAKR